MSYVVDLYEILAHYLWTCRINGVLRITTALCYQSHPLKFSAACTNSGLGGVLTCADVLRRQQKKLERKKWIPRKKYLSHRRLFSPAFFVLSLSFPPHLQQDNHNHPLTRQRSRPTAQSTRKHLLNFAENFPRCTPPSLSCKFPLWDAAFSLLHSVDECDRGGGQRSAVPQFHRPVFKSRSLPNSILDKSLPFPGLVAALRPRPTSTSVALLDI